MARIVIVGASDQGRCTLDLLRRLGTDEPVGFLDDALAPGTTVDGSAVLGTSADLAALRADHRLDQAVVAIGDNDVRAQVVAQLRAADPDLVFATLIDSAATVATGVTVGAGTVVMAGAVVGTGASLGEHVLVCASASLDHHSTVEDFASLGPGAVTGGRVQVGRGSAVALGARVLHGRSIGAHTVVGAGSVVTRDVGPGQVAWGAPARPQRPRQPGDRYL